MKTSYYVLSLYCEFENLNYYLGLPKTFQNIKKALKYAKDTGRPTTQFCLSEYSIDEKDLIETKNLETWIS